MNNFVILGGGISGLSSAFFLRYFYPSAQITLIEASPRVGGMIQSHIDREYHYVAELGPRSIRKGAYMGPIYKILNDIGLYHDSKERVDGDSRPRPHSEVRLHLHGKPAAGAAAEAELSVDQRVLTERWELRALEAREGLFAQSAEKEALGAGCERVRLFAGDV